MKKPSQSSFNIVIGGVNMETVAFFLLNRVRQKGLGMCMEPACLASATSFSVAKEAEAKEPFPHCLA